jgi:nucleoside-diphosphate-sugar epimerase
MSDLRPELLLHLAWTTEHGVFWSDPANLDWVSASLRLTREFIDAKGQRLVASGSCAEYDWNRLDDGVCRENETPIKPATLYGVAKDSFRRLAEKVCADSGVSFGWGRVFLVYGEGEYSARLVPSVIRALLLGESARVSHCRQVRDLMSAEDYGRAFSAFLTSPQEGAVNIASGKAIALREIVEYLSRSIGGNVEYGAVAAPPHEPPKLAADVTKLKSDLGFEPKYGLAEGLDRLVAYWKRKILDSSLA